MTIREIARQAGVAASTVSLVLNSKPGVRKEMREKIARMLLENGYTIKVGVCDVETIGIDTREDLERAEAFLKNHKEMK